eukprot:886134-Pyramimonas_sp.AAC.1
MSMQATASVTVMIGSHTSRQKRATRRVIWRVLPHADRSSATLALSRRTGIVSLSLSLDMSRSWVSQLTFLCECVILLEGIVREKRGEKSNSSAVLINRLIKGSMDGSHLRHFSGGCN